MRFSKLELIGLGLMVLALSFMLFGCGGSGSSGSTGPSMSDMGNAGFTSGDQHPDQSCLHDAQGNKIPDPKGPKPKPPVVPPTPPPVDPPVTPPPAKVCDDPHYGGGNSGVDCGKDDPNKINGRNDGPTKGKK